LNFQIAYSLHRSARTSLLLRLSRIPRRIGFKNARLAFLYSDTRLRPPEKHDVLRNLALISDDFNGRKLPDELRLFAPTLKELPLTIQSRLPEAGSYALIVPGSAWETKRWSAGGYHQVVEYLIDKGLEVVLTGSADEAEICREVAGELKIINLAGEADLDTALYLTMNARLVICNDSMALHMASAGKIPTVAVFCATVPEFGFGPWQNQALIVEKKGLDCRPCARHGSRSCPNQSRACIDGLPAAEVIKAAQKLLAD
jgi:heptosyltransferase-2